MKANEMKSNDEFNMWALARTAELEAELEAAQARDAPFHEQVAILERMDNHTQQISQRVDHILNDPTRTVTEGHQADFITLDAVSHQPPAGFGGDWLATIIGARLTDDGLLEYATRSAPTGDRYRHLDDDLPLKVHTPGDHPWETSHHLLRRFINGARLGVEVGTILANGGTDEAAARTAYTVDRMIEEWVYNDARRYGEVRIGGQWMGASPGRGRPDYAVLLDGATSTDAAAALYDLLSKAEDVISIDRTQLRVATVNDPPGPVERWNLTLGDYGPQLRVEGAEVWMWGDGEVRLMARNPDGGPVHITRLPREP